MSGKREESSHQQAHRQRRPRGRAPLDPFRPCDNLVARQTGSWCQAFALAASLLLFVAWTVACAPQEVLWPEAALRSAAPETLLVGAAAVPITPQQYVFLAGGIPYRLALGVHDDLWARVVVFDNGELRIALAALDLIGIQYDDVVRLRQAVAERAPVDYLAVAATHTHSAPDVIGAWSGDFLCGEDPYMPFLRERVVEAVAQAVDRLRPARMRVAAGTSGDRPLSRDTRDPVLIDDTLTVWQAVDAQSDEVIATAVHYAAHPILVPSLNFDVSSDFPHWLREAVENGVSEGDILVAPQAGVCLYFNGALGGRIVPAHTEPLTTGATPDPAHAEAQAYGYRLAHRALDVLAESGAWLDSSVNLEAITRRLRVPLENPALSLGIATCLIDRAAPGGMLDTEVGIVRIGELELFMAPGMIFPESVLGGIAPLWGSDFPFAPPEQASLMSLTTRQYPVTLGLANDMLGNIIPMALWDASPPFSTPDGSAPYGEIISPGPQAAGIIIDGFVEIARPGDGA